MVIIVTTTATTTENKQHEPYRSKDEILFDILTTVKAYESRGGALKIKLLYSSRLSSEQLGRYLKELIDNRLLTIDSSKGRPVAPSATDYRKAKGTRRGDTFHITENGLRYLEMIQEMKQNIGINI